MILVKLRMQGEQYTIGTMSESSTPRTIRLYNERPQSLTAPSAAFDAATALVPNGAVADRLQRPLRDLRISVTDR